MGKSEILMLLAGVALSIMLAMVAIPMFSSGSEMADRQQVQQELLAIKSAIPLIKAMEGDTGTIKTENIAKHIEGFSLITPGTPADGLKGKFLKTEATYTIADAATTVTVTVTTNNSTENTIKKIDLSKFARLNEICDGGATAPTPSETSLTCVMKR